MRRYIHLDRAERKEIEYYLKKNYSLRKIGEILKRPHSTISREVQRNRQKLGKGRGKKKLGEYI